MTTKTKSSKFQQLVTDRRTVTTYQLVQNRRQIREQQAARVEPVVIVTDVKPWMGPYTVKAGKE